MRTALDLIKVFELCICNQCRFLAGGGVYATEWTSRGIKIWHFPRSKIPDNIQQNEPDPGTWDTPLAAFSGDCEFDQRFYEAKVIHAKFLYKLQILTLKYKKIGTI
jgi:hypothetical protein